MSKFAVYLRISQDRELGTDEEGLAVDRQRTLINALLKDRGHTTSDELEYVDNSVSATSKKARPAYQRMLKDWEAGLFEGIAAYDLDRLTRKPREIEDLVDAAERRGLMLATVSGDADLSTDNGILFARIKASVAASETSAKGRRQRAANAQAAAKGEHYWREGIRPFGHNMDGTLHPVEAPALVAVIDRIIDGAAITTACRDLNAAGLKTNRGQEWHSTSLMRILRNKRIAGVRVYKEQEFKAAWEKIIDADKFRTLELELTTREKPRKAKSRENLLTGIALCGQTVYDNYVMYGRECRGTMGQSRNNKGIAAYRCSIGKHNAKNADYTEEVVVQQILLLITVPGAEAVLNNQPNVDIASLRTRRAEAVAWWKEQLKTAQATRVPLADLAVYREGHEAELAAIDAEIFQYEKSSLFADMWSKFAYFDNETLPEARRIWDALPLERKRRIVTTLFSEIVLAPGVRGGRFDPQTVELEWTETATRLQMMLNAHGQEEIEAGRLVVGGSRG